MISTVPGVVEGQKTSTGLISARDTRRCLGDTTHVVADARVLPVETVDTIAPGVTYRCIFRPVGPWLLHIATIALRDRHLAIDAVRATDHMVGRERVSAIAARLAARGEHPVVAINADFFDLGTGEVENNLVVRGEWVKGAVMTDSPHDEFDNAHTQFAVDAAGTPRIGRFALDGVVRGAARRLALAGINYRPPRLPGLVLYTPWYGPSTLRDTLDRMAASRPRDPDATPSAATSAATPPASRPTAAPAIAQLRADSARTATMVATRSAVELQLVAIDRRGSTWRYRVRSRTTRTGGGMAIPERGAVLSATGDSAIAFVRALARRGGVVEITATLDPSGFTPRTSVGGWPRVVADGNNVGTVADSVEGTFPRFSTSRHPRSAIAISRDSSQLMLVVVDGRRPWSVGMSLAELGDALISLGAWQGMNLDGGGSSALWIDGSIVNYPSDPAGERAVGNALIVRRRP